MCRRCGRCRTRAQLASRQLCHVARELISLRLPQLTPNWAMGKGVLGHVGHPLEIVVAKVGVAEAEEDGHWAAVAALVLQVVCAGLETLLGI